MSVLGNNVSTMFQKHAFLKKMKCLYMSFPYILAVNGIRHCWEHWNYHDHSNVWWHNQPCQHTEPFTKSTNDPKFLGTDMWWCVVVISTCLCWETLPFNYKHIWNHQVILWDIFPIEGLIPFYLNFTAGNVAWHSYVVMWSLSLAHICAGK